MDCQIYFFIAFFDASSHKNVKWPAITAENHLLNVKGDVNRMFIHINYFPLKDEFFYLFFRLSVYVQFDSRVFSVYGIFFPKLKRGQHRRPGNNSALFRMCFPLEIFLF